MFLKSHQWNMVPYTRYEIRREMRVRESMHTVMIFPKRYQDVDTGKYCTDKIATLYSESLSDLAHSCAMNQKGFFNNYHHRLDAPFYKEFPRRYDEFDLE